VVIGIDSRGKLFGLGHGCGREDVYAGSYFAEAFLVDEFAVASLVGEEESRFDVACFHQ